ncbi:MAG: TonB-dependent receptor [Cytophagales bacterium]|nr:TonB-dependent receptor [Cytophagales bacterium]
MKKILLLKIFLMLMFTSTVAWAQERMVTGKVTSAEDGTTLPGVNVLLKGTSVGTVSDSNGAYRISIPSTGGILVFSFIGFDSQEVDVNGRTSVDVQLASDVTQLSEVVVTGYNTSLKKDVTGAISSVKGKTIENLPLQTFDRAIQGRLSGVQVASSSGQPGGAINVRIRGTGSINASNRPLYIVDGVQMNQGGTSTQASSNALGGVNPNDIESIEVLKDASATAIYGAQGANGVVIISTKKGKAGKPVVTINAQEGAVQPLNLYEMMNSRQLAELRIEAFENNPNSGGAAAAIALHGDPNDPNLTNYNWVDNMFRTSRLKQYDISVSGGDERTKYFLSAAYNFQEGQIIMSDWERMTTRLNITSKLSDKFTIAANLSLSSQSSFGTIADGNFVNGPFVAAFLAIPNVPAYTETGEYTEYGALTGNHLFGYNIIQGVNLERREGKTLTTVSNMSLTYTITPQLKVTGYGGVNVDLTRDYNNRPGSIPAFASTNGSALVADRRFINYNTNVVAEYSKEFGGKHKIGSLVGYEFKAESRDQISASANQFGDPSFLLLSSGTPSGATGVFTEYKRNGVFGQVKYDYNDRYVVDFTLRRDGSSRFTPGNRFGTFYAGSVGWRISSESFMSGTSSWLDNLKLRASYGITGNSEIADFGWNQTVGASTVAGRYLNAATVRLNRPLGVPLGWETSAQTNIGLDFGFLDGRVSGTVDLWNKLNSDLLFNQPLDLTTGFGGVLANVGEVKNKGIDIDLSVIPVKIGDFTWRVTYNQTFQDNEITKLPDNAARLDDLTVGKSINTYYGARYAGVNPANGRPMYYDINNELTYTQTNADRVIIGDGFIRTFGGVANTFEYKGISLEVFFQFQGGNDVFNSDLYNIENAGQSTDNQRINQLDRWQNPGDITSVPRAIQGGEPLGSGLGIFSTRLISDGGYTRLKQVTLSYQVPSSLLKKTGIAGLRVYAQGLNLATFTKFNGIDPEVINETASAFGTYPNGRQLTAGLTLTF